MKKLITIFLILLCVVSASAQNVLLEAGKRLPLSDSSGSAIVHIAGWGDSMMAGAGASEDSTLPNSLRRLSGDIYYNGGMAGETTTQIVDRFLNHKELWPYNTIIWMGRNNISDSAVVINHLKQMVDSLAVVGNTNYLILTVCNNQTEPFGSAGYIAVAKINAGIKANFPTKYFDVRRYVIDNYNPLLPTDVTAYNDSMLPPSLMADATHLNSAGNWLVGQRIYTAYPRLFSVSSSILRTASFKNWFNAPLLNTDNDLLFRGNNLNIKSGNLGFSTKNITTALTLGEGKGIRLFNRDSIDKGNRYEEGVFGFEANILTIGTRYNGAGMSPRSMQLSAQGLSMIFGPSPSYIAGAIRFTSAAAGGDGSMMGLIGSAVSSGTNRGFALLPAISKTGAGSFSCLWISPWLNTLPTGGETLLIDAGYNSTFFGGGTHTTLFKVDKDGKTTTQNLAIAAASTILLDTTNNKIAVINTTTGNVTKSYWPTNTGVTSITGTANQVIASASTGPVVLSTPQDIAITSLVRFGGVAIGTTATSSYGIIINNSPSAQGLALLTTGTSSSAFNQAGSMSPAPNANALLFQNGGGIVENSTGNHTYEVGANFSPPTITPGAATATYGATVRISDQPTGTFSQHTNALWVEAGTTRLGGDLIIQGPSYTSGGYSVLARNNTSGRVEIVAATDAISSAAGTLSLNYAVDYVFTGTTATYTLPAVSGVLQGKLNMITIKNAGSGSITVNSNSGANDIYSTSAVNTINIAPGEYVFFNPINSIFYVKL